MIIGVPKEVKQDERRVAAVPPGVEMLKRAGHLVLVEAGAGDGAGFTDEEYLAAGAEIVPNGPEVWERADLIVKVKEPLPEEYEYIREGTSYLYISTPGGGASSGKSFGREKNGGHCL